MAPVSRTACPLQRAATPLHALHPCCSPSRASRRGAGEMVSGRRAWAGLTHPQIMLAVALQKQALELPPDTPAALVALAQARARPSIGLGVRAFRQWRCRSWRWSCRPTCRPRLWRPHKHARGPA